MSSSWIYEFSFLFNFFLLKKMFFSELKHVRLELLSISFVVLGASNVLVA